MAGFMPAIHAFSRGEKDVDGREHQGVYARLTTGFGAAMTVSTLSGSALKYVKMLTSQLEAVCLNASYTSRD